MVFWNKTKKENKQTQEKEIETNVLGKAIRLLGMGLMALLLVLTLIVMNKIPNNSYNQVMIGLAFGSVFLIWAVYKMINATIGFKFLVTLYKARKMKNKGYGLFKEFSLAGKPIYHLVKYDDIIRYKTKVNGQDKNGMALFNPYARYEDFGANIPIVEGTYNDISLKNVFTGNRIGMNPDLADKIIVESGITPKDLDDVKKHRKWLMFLLGGIAIAGILSFDLFAQRLAEANASTAACYKELGKSATITAGGFVKVGVDKLKSKLF